MRLHDIIANNTALIFAMDEYTLQKAVGNNSGSPALIVSMEIKIRRMKLIDTYHAQIMNVERKYEHR